MHGFDVLSYKKDSFVSLIELERIIINLLNTNNLSSAKIKINVWRQEGGLFASQNNAVNFSIRIFELGSNKSIKKNINISPFKIDINSPLKGIKTCNSLTYILSANHAIKNNYHDSLLLNSNNELTELSSSNIFLGKENYFVTPNLDSGCLSGVMRKNVIKLLKNKKIEIIETSISLNDLENYDICFASNVYGLYEIERIENYTFNNKNIVKNLENELYRQ